MTSKYFPYGMGPLFFVDGGLFLLTLTFHDPMALRCSHRCDSVLESLHFRLGFARRTWTWNFKKPILVPGQFHRVIISKKWTENPTVAWILFHPGMGPKSDRQNVAHTIPRDGFVWSGDR